MTDAIQVQQEGPASPALAGSRTSGSSLSRIARAFRRDPVGLASIIFLVFVILLVLAAPVVQRYAPNASNLAAFQHPPSAAHWMGTDNGGRDIWSRLVWGGRISLFVATLATAITTVIGAAVGAVSGYYRGLVDGIVMRITDTVLSFPQIVLLLMLAALVGPSVWNVVLIIGFLNWTGMARLIRGHVLSLREQSWVTAARAIGANDLRILFRHLLPNVIPTMVVNATFSFGAAIFAEASLSFLGLGVPLPTPSWGNMLQNAQDAYTLEKLPWVWVFPGLTVVLVILAVSYVGETLRRATAGSRD